MVHPLSTRYCVARKLNHGSNSWITRPYRSTAKSRIWKEVISDRVTMTTRTAVRSVSRSAFSDALVFASFAALASSIAGSGAVDLPGVPALLGVDDMARDRRFDGFGGSAAFSKSL